MKPNRKRQVTTITLDPEVVKEAKQIGANLSRISELALKEFIARNKPRNPCSDPRGCDDRNVLNSKEHKITCRRVSGRLPGESLRKLRPSSRSAGS